VTAIFAYAAGDIAFIAGDSLRGDPLKAFSIHTVFKIHHWGDRLVFGQAGSQYLSDWVMETRRRKSQWFDSATGSTIFDDLEVWFEKTLGISRATHYQEALAKCGPALSMGVLLAASVDSHGKAQRLTSYDFATGVRNVLAGECAAEGVDATLFTRIAAKHMIALKSRGAISVPLDEWAQMCVSDAIAAHGVSVGWPCDLLISRPSAHGGRILVQRRINNSSTCGDPLFAS
jgi:hypothetical protein